MLAWVKSWLYLLVERNLLSLLWFLPKWLLSCLPFVWCRAWAMCVWLRDSVHVSLSSLLKEDSWIPLPGDVSFKILTCKLSFCPFLVGLIVAEWEYVTLCLFPASFDTLSARGSLGMIHLCTNFSSVFSWHRWSRSSPFPSLPWHSWPVWTQHCRKLEENICSNVHFLTGSTDTFLWLFAGAKISVICCGHLLIKIKISVLLVALWLCRWQA